MNTNKYKLLGALFAEANKLGIEQETLRDDIAPGIIGKRLSKAKVWEVARVLDHIKGKNPPPAPSRGEYKYPSRVRWIRQGWHRCSSREEYKYPSSRAGLIEEIRDIAKARFGDDYAAPLNAFCARFGEPDGFRRMRVSQMKVVKQRLLELQKMDPR